MQEASGVPFLNTKQGWSLCSNSAETLQSKSEMERNTEIHASTRDEALLIPAAMHEESWGAPRNGKGDLTSLRRYECGRPGFDLWMGKVPWRRKWQPTTIFLPGKSNGQRSLAGLQFMASHGVAKSQTPLSNFTHSLINWHFLFFFTVHGDWEYIVCLALYPRLNSTWDLSLVFWELWERYLRW